MSARILIPFVISISAVSHINDGLLHKDKKTSLNPEKIITNAHIPAQDLIALSTENTKASFELKDIDSDLSKQFSASLFFIVYRDIKPRRRTEIICDIRRMYPSLRFLVITEPM